MTGKIRHIIKDKSFYLAVVFAFTIFIKCILFHYFCYGYCAFRSLFINPIDFFAFYVSKILPAIFVAAFTFLFQKKCWTIVFSVLMDMWIIANLLYWRSYGLFFDADVILMAGNLAGFSKSILAYVNGEIFIFIAITIAYSIFVYILKTKDKNIYMSMTWLLLSLLIYITDVTLYTRASFSENESRMYKVKKMAKGEISASMCRYVEGSSILHYIPAMYIYKIYNTTYLNHITKKIIFTNQEKNIINEICVYNTEDDSARTNLVVILVESLENWALEFKDEHNKLVAPNINKT